MSKSGWKIGDPDRRQRRLGFEGLERRSMLSDVPGVGFGSAFGLGSTGRYSTIHSNAVAIDSAGDTFITGSFRGSVGFDPATTGSTIATNGTQDTFVAKYSPTNALVWVQTFVGHPTTANGQTTYAVSQGSAIAVDGSGNVFVAGSFGGTVDYGSGSSLTELSSPGQSDVFTAKLNASGSLQWVASAAGTAGDTDSATALSLDGSGGVMIAGSYSDAITIGSKTLTAGGASDGFAARINASGQFAWSVSTRGQSGSNAGANGIAVDGAGNLALAGYFSGTVGFGTGTVANNLVAAGSNDAVVWKLDASGNALWAHAFGGADYDTATAVSFDPSGNLYATGLFSGTVAFGSGSSADSLTAGPIFDAFTVKLAPDGTEAWAKGFVGPGGWSKGQSIAYDPSSGGLVIAGTFAGTVDFDPGTATDNLTSGGSTDAFVTGLDGSGNLVYALRAGQSNANNAAGVAVNSSGVAVATGTYSGSIAIGTTKLQPAGVTSVFVAQVANQTQPSTPAAPALEASSDTGTNNTTSINKPVFDLIAAVASNTLALLRDGVVVGQRLGSGAIQDPGPVPDGTHVYAAIQLSPAGIASPTSPSTTVIILTTPPPRPAAPALYQADDSGGPGLTNVRSPRLTGTAQANARVQLFTSTGTLLATTTASPTGSYLVAVTSQLSDGMVAIDALATDAANNVSPSGSPFILTIDGTAPMAPPAPSILAADDSGAPGITSIRSPRLTGTAEPNATVQLFTSTGTLLATTTASPTGSYTAKITPVLPDGVYAINAVATDAANNVGKAGLAYSLTINGTPPASPSAPVLLVADDSGVAGDGITNVRSPRLVTSAASGLTVEIVNASNVVVGSSSVWAGGSYTITPSNSLPDGSYTFRAVAVDSAGNQSAASAAINLLILATPPPRPSAPSLMAADDTGVAGDGLTSVTRPRLVGTAAPGGRIDWIGSNGSVVVSTMASTTSGSYQLQQPTAFASGTYSIQVRETDVAGNVSAVGSPFNLTIQSTLVDTFADGRTDVAVFRPADQTFYLQPPSTSSLYAKPFGIPGDIPVSGDFFGDGHGDIAIFRPSTATFYVSEANSNNFLVDQWGAKGDIAVPGDYDGSGKTSVAVFRPSDGTFYIRMNGAYYSKAFGQTGDIPVPADYFGDGRTDLAVYRPSTSTFYAYDPANDAFKSVTLGQTGDTPVPADYEGIGHADIAVFRPSNLTFYVQMSTNAAYQKTFGIPGDIPVTGDYFGTGHASIAVFRPSTATFYAYDAITSAYLGKQWGAPNIDKPVNGPITLWYSLSGNGSPGAISAHGNFSAEIVPLEAQAVEPTKILKPKPKLKPAGVRDGSRLFRQGLL